jgi:hypothetical protein
MLGTVKTARGDAVRLLLAALSSATVWESTTMICEELQARSRGGIAESAAAIRNGVRWDGYPRVGGGERRLAGAPVRVTLAEAHSVILQVQRVLEPSSRGSRDFEIKELARLAADG